MDACRTAGSIRKPALLPRRCISESSASSNTASIVGTRVKVDWEALGLPVTAVTSVTASDNRPLKEVVDGMRSTPFVYQLLWRSR
jgi:hypothetical protein